MIDYKWTKELEKELIEEYIEKEKFKFKDSNKPVFSIDTPPPYVNRPIHIGQSATYTIMDMIARYKRMKGYSVLFPLGLDRNGLPIEMEAEKKYKISILNTDRKTYVEYCEKLLSEMSDQTRKTFKMLGISFNEWEECACVGGLYKTDSEKYRALTQKTFLDLYKKGLIYLDEKVTNYCPGCKTTLADSEIDYKIADSLFNTVLFTVKETGEQIPIATTRPELICSLGMVVYNPDDERYKHLEGKTAISPIFNKEVLIKAHPIAKLEKGTGLVMMCSAGDYSDIRFFMEQNIKPIMSIDISGKMNKNAGILEGLTVKEARQKMVEILKEKNLITEQKTIQHKVPICERSKDEIEFVSLKEFYLKQLEHVEKIKELADQINFSYAPTKKIFLDWLEVVSIDWPISRRRYYATEIPLWYCKNCNEIILGKEGVYQKPWCENPPIDSCPKCGGKEFIGETRVLDTWFDSSNTPLYIHKYGTEFFEKNPVCSLRPQGKEIVRTWLYYTVLKAYLLTGKKIFDDVYIHQHILDENGNKMSKSAGNSIDPQEIIKEFGAESFRLWTAYEGNLNQKDFKCSKERIKSEQKTLNKLWNVARFIGQFKLDKDITAKYNELDLFVRKEINDLIIESDQAYKKYDFHNPLLKIKFFLTNTFSSHYLELIKSRAYNQEEYFTKEEQMGAIDTLYYCLNKILYLLYPVIPFTTNRISKEMFDTDLDDEIFPDTKKYFSKLTLEDIEKINNAIWKEKKEKGYSLKEKVSVIKITNKYKYIEKDLIKTHNILKIEYKEESEGTIDVEL
jgi:valyl-tRNA synthetase